ncbi:MAG: hypothetical protein R6V86_07615 [Spirochaetia bacterium]
MSTQQVRSPTVVIPFDSECKTELCQDVCVYLRPEANGIQVESAMMRTISTNPRYNENVKLVYLANIPGEFIAKHRIIEQHYRLKISFAKQGKRLFTDYMQQEFSRYYKVSFEEAEILGAFEAMKRLHYTREGLFNLWVPAEDVLHLNGQTIKRVKDLFIVNYDIPAILFKNRTSTDIAVMILRTRLGPGNIHSLMEDMVERLKVGGLLQQSEAFTRVFHFSRSPFEQILDGIGFLYQRDGTHIPLQEIQFYHYLLQQGMSPTEIQQVLHYPIFGFSSEKGKLKEQTVYAASYGMDYKRAYQMLLSAKAQILLD